MVSKITKSIASRIPLDLYFQIQKEAEERGLNMKDYLLEIIERRNQNQETKIPQIVAETINETKSIQSKNQKKKTPKSEIFGNELDFSFD